MPTLGLDWHDRFGAHDLVTGRRWNWHQHNFVRLGPETEPGRVALADR
jgi:starch synthase (maltosyl-transferring)